MVWLMRIVGDPGKCQSSATRGNVMRKLMSIGTIKYLGLAALGIFIGGAIATPGYAQEPKGSAQNVYTCVSEVYYKIHSTTGTAMTGGAYLAPPSPPHSSPPIGFKVGPHPTITESASECHGKTRQAFIANTAWSNSQNACQRFHSNNSFSGTLQVIATDYFLELGNSAGYNLVAYYGVICNNGASIPIISNPPVNPIMVLKTPLL